ncbi:MAG: ImmA/IrrE family metallo-endopeptidase, partial [Pseudomonadota bacterium]
MSSQSKQKAYKPTHHNRLKHRKLGAKIRALRRKHGYNQSEFANLLGISASYLNLLEHDRRRLRVELMLDLANLLHINIETLFEDDHAHLLSGAMEVLSDELFSDIDLTNTDIQYLIETSPNVAQALLHLYDSWVEQNDVIRNLSGKLEDYSQSALGAQRVASEIISDYFQEHNNFFIDLEKAAMQIVESNNRHFGKLDLQNYLQKAHGVNIIDFPLKTTHGVLRQYDPKAKILSLASHLNEATKRFALAYQVASLSAKSVIEMLTKEAGFTDKKIKVVADIALSNYLASAILMPYEPFLKSAQDFRYDVELLQIKWNASF